MVMNILIYNTNNKIDEYEELNVIELLLLKLVNVKRLRMFETNEGRIMHVNVNAYSGNTP